jgi:DNA-binding transcriptional LysR family regulator
MSAPHTEPPADLPLRALLVFEATARRLKMVRAAADLGLTQGAISRQIKALEGRLGEPLFRRGPRGLTLTEAGDLLSDYVARGLGELATGLYRLGQPRRRTTLAVTASRTFALRVLAPRVGRFVARHPWIDLRVEGHRYFADPDRAEVDLSIRLGQGGWRQGVELRLSEEVMFPVCAPALLPPAGAAADPARFLRSQVMLHYVERPYWAAWLRVAGLPAELAEGGARFGETALALAAAEAGQGVAIARGIHVRDALLAGRLARPFEASFADNGGYWAVATPAAAERSTVKAFVAWLREEFAVAGGDAAAGSR